MALKPARLQWSDDGSLLSLDYGDVYFQRGRGLEESEYVFLQGNSLPARFGKCEGAFRIAELGFGSGLNFLLTAQAFLKHAPPQARLFYVSFEKHPVPRTDLEKIHSFFNLPQSAEMLAQYPPMIEGFHHLHLGAGRIRLMLVFGDVSEMLPQLTGRFDAWYLDGFAPAKNPGMWEEKLFPLIAARTAPGGTLATFSAAGQVRRGLQAAGFMVEKTRGFGVKRDMTVARMEGDPNASGAPKTVAVLGAGIAGCASAHALARRGYAVTLIDRHAACAQETSGNATAILYPKLTAGPSPLGGFHSHAFLFARSLARHLGLPSWRECGVMHYHLNVGDEERAAQLAGGNYPPELCTPGETGIRQPIAGMLSPVEFCARLSAADGIRPCYGRQAAALRRDEGGWQVFGKDGEVIAAADAVVIAAGHDSRRLAQTQWLPLQSLRGQVTYLKANATSAGFSHVACHDGYFTPAVDGIHSAGATFQKEEPATPQLRPEDDTENLAKLNRFLPELGFTAADVTGGRAGYRATTPDKLPLAGPLPDFAATRERFAALRQGGNAEGAAPRHPGLFVTTGFGAHGMSGAPLAGEIVAAMVSGDPVPVPAALMEHLLPERFIFRDLKRRKI